MADEALAAALATLPQLTALQLGDTSAGDATLGALTFAYRASAWAETYGAHRLRMLNTPLCSFPMQTADRPRYSPLSLKY